MLQIGLEKIGNTASKACINSLALRISSLNRADISSSSVVAW